MVHVTSQKMENSIPDLLENDADNITTELATVATVKNALSEARIKARQKFQSFFEDGFTEPNQICKLEYDQDSLFIVQPNATFLRDTGKRRPKTEPKREPETPEPEPAEPENAVKPEKDPAYSPAAAALRPRRESGGAAGDPAAGRRSSPRTNSRSSSPDQAQPPTRVRRSSVRVQSPLVRYGNQSPGRKGEPPRADPISHKPSVKRPHDSRKKDTASPSQNKVRVNNESFKNKKSRPNKIGQTPSTASHNAEPKKIETKPVKNAEPVKVVKKPVEKDPTYSPVLTKKATRQPKGVTGKLWKFANPKP